jgi:hypothetical protein
MSKRHTFTSDEDEIIILGCKEKRGNTAIAKEIGGVTAKQVAGRINTLRANGKIPKNENPESMYFHSFPFLSNIAILN